MTHKSGERWNKISVYILLGGSKSFGYNSVLYDTGKICFKIHLLTIYY